MSRGRPAAHDSVLNDWEDTTRRRREQPATSMDGEGRRRRSVVTAHSSRRSGDMEELAANFTAGTAAYALHGRQKLHFDEQTFVQHLSSAAVEVTPPAKLDSVTFNFTDRVAAWFGGFGRELRLLKEAHLDDAVQADGSRVSVSTYTRFRRLSLVLVGGEESELNRVNAASTHRVSGGLQRATGPEMLRAMTDLMLRAHYEAVAFGTPCAHDPDLVADDVVGVVDDLRDEYPLGFWDRLYLRMCDGFTPAEKDLLLERGEYRPRAVSDDATAVSNGGVLVNPSPQCTSPARRQSDHRSATAAAATGAVESHAERRARLSISDLAPSVWPPPRSPSAKKASQPGGVSTTANTRAVSRARRAAARGRIADPGQTRPLSPSRDATVVHSEHL